MEIIDKGVLAPSFMDFSLPSEFAQHALYYSPQFGHFICDGRYEISRDHLDLFLLCYLCSGTLCVETRGGAYALSADQVALIDCRHPHRYYCPDTADFLWFHFAGNSSGLYADYLFERFGVAHAGGHIPWLREHFEAVLSSTQSALSDEHLLSQHIHAILSGLAVPDRHAVTVNHALMPALDYIHSHFESEMELQQLAALCSVSISHFIRSFKKYVGCTPHEYLLLYRLRQSKRLLRATDLTIEQIAEACGFNSASHFARAFRQNAEMSPTQFRKLHF